eukprot:CAMPEP_0184393576 /NCGR_PEP_ID=MMETSP0007-20130409/35212_1 /TAXON_ID=97485 /ORGANISM="Prymnesium parvum, Strain Texoma1" /LENGTH=220 /DNA_ID=CAMNT_0026744645 /DNA_START=497 /DNA_END=1156 /DNA_ORIENTATION=-
MVSHPTAQVVDLTPLLISTVVQPCGEAKSQRKERKDDRAAVVHEAHHVIGWANRLLIPRICFVLRRLLEFLILRFGHQRAKVNEQSLDFHVPIPRDWQIFGASISINEGKVELGDKLHFWHHLRILRPTQYPDGYNPVLDGSVRRPKNRAQPMRHADVVIPREPVAHIHVCQPLLHFLQLFEQHKVAGDNDHFLTGPCHREPSDHLWSTPPLPPQAGALK